MKTNRLRYCVPFILLAIYFQDAESKEPMPTRSITVVFPDTIVKTAVLSSETSRNIHADRNYFWFSNNTICHNMGGYSGKLLHGKYEVFDKEKRLLCSGKFKYGLKEGEWTAWSGNGMIKELVDYKKGKIQGKRRTYDSSGKLVSELNYKDNLLNGTSHFYQPDTVISMKYRKGAIVDKSREKSHIFSFLKRDTDNLKKSEGKREKNKNRSDEDKK